MPDADGAEAIAVRDRPHHPKDGTPRSTARISGVKSKSTTSSSGERIEPRTTPEGQAKPSGPVTQRALADGVCFATAHVNRSLQELGRRGVIEPEGRTLRILERQRLRSIAKLNVKYLHLGTRATA